MLAHEIAHIAQRHAASQITKQLVANGFLGLLGAVLGNDPGAARTAQAGARVLAGGYMLKFSRDDEREADRIGLQIMQRAGWDPRGMPEFMEILRREQGRDPGSVEVFLSSHPAPGGARRRAAPHPRRTRQRPSRQRRVPRRQGESAADAAGRQHEVRTPIAQAEPDSEGDARELPKMLPAPIRQVV